MPKSKSHKSGGGKKKGSSSHGGSAKSKEPVVEEEGSSKPKMDEMDNKESSASSSGQASNSKQNKAEESKKKGKALKVPRKKGGSTPDAQKNKHNHPSEHSLKSKSKESGGVTKKGTTESASQNSSLKEVMDTKDDLKPLFVDPWSKGYTFLQENGSDLHVKESMAETQYSFRIPAHLIELFIVDENELLEEMKQLKDMLPPYCNLVRDAVRRHEDLIASYSIVKTTLKANKGPFFKRSTLKSDLTLELAPVNLHVQRLVAEVPGTGRALIHDIITVGAFTAFSQKFRDGGLLQYAELLGGRPLPGGAFCCLPRMMERLASGGRASLDGDKASAMYQAEAAVQTIEEARASILESCVDLLEVVKSDDSAALPDLLQAIRTESSRVDTALYGPVVAATHQELASNSSSGAAPHLGCLPGPPLRGRLSTLPAAAPATHTPPDWRSAAAAVTAAAAALTALTAELVTAAESNTAASLAPVVAELRVGCDAALAAVRLARATARLREKKRTQLLRDAARHRRDVCFSHAVTAACVGLLTRLWCRPSDPAFIDQLASVGPLLQFEGLLSYYGHEACMVQDMVVAVRDLEVVEFILEPVAAFKGPGVPEVRLEGGRGRLLVYLPTPEALLTGRPSDAEVRFRARPVYFNVGINEQATFSEYMGGTGPQRAFNEEAFRLLADYVNSCGEQQLPVRPTAGDDPGPEVSDLLIQLGQLVRSGRPKNVRILQLAAEICRSVAGVRFCSCKSAKDRTAMAVTLEQVNILTSELQLASAERQRALALMRSDGTRRRNAEKNVGSPRFSFNTLQLLTFPEEYRAPPGTYGDVES